MRMALRSSGTDWLPVAEDAAGKWTATNPAVFEGALGAPAPDHVGDEAIIQLDPGNRGTGFQAFGNNLDFEFPRKPATALGRAGYAYFVHVKCPLKK